jgi:hypothetical protein
VIAMHVADPCVGLEVVVIPILFGDLPTDHAKAEAAEEHQEPDRQKTWPDNFGLPTPILKYLQLNLVQVKSILAIKTA